MLGLWAFSYPYQEVYRTNNDDDDDDYDKDDKIAWLTQVSLAWTFFLETLLETHNPAEKNKRKKTVTLPWNAYNKLGCKKTPNLIFFVVT